MSAESDSDRPTAAAFAGSRPSFVEQAVESSRGLCATFAQTLYCVFRGRREPGAVVRQMYEIGNRSLGFVSVVMGFIGMILVFQGGLQTQRVVPDLSGLGAAFLEILVRDLSASICALMLATRVGAGIAAEIGSMVVTEQVDALRMCATDPIDYLVKPRFLASICMTPVLVVVSGSVAFATGMGAAYAFFGINPNTFMNLALVDPGDFTVGIAKCFAYGAVIPVVSAHAGLTTFGGSAGVGAATTRAVVHSSLAVIVLDFLISGGGYWLFES